MIQIRSFLKILPIISKDNENLVEIKNEYKDKDYEELWMQFK